MKKYFGGAAVLKSKKLHVGSVIVFMTILSLSMGFTGGQKEESIGYETVRPDLRVGVASFPPGLAPAFNLSNSAMRITYNMFETLIFQDPKDGYKLKPSLAVSWEKISPTIHELKLREGVKFHNGDEFTSADVKFSFERLLDPDSVYVLAHAVLSVIEKVETPDPLTVRIITKKPDPAILKRIATPWGSWIISAKYFQEVGFEEFNRNPVGTGPFKLNKYSTNEIVLEVFNNYWGEKPNASKIIYSIIPEISARITALVNGEQDIICAIPPDQIPSLERYDNLVVKTISLDNIQMLSYRLELPGMGDVKVRQAMNLSIDRELLVSSLWVGNTTVPCSHQYPAYGSMYNKKYPKPEFNPAKARKLIKESSYQGELLLLDVRAGHYTNGVIACEAIVNMWTKVGLNAKVRILDNPWNNKDAAGHLWSNSMRFADPLGGLWMLWGPGSGAQTRGWEPEDFNELGSALEQGAPENERFQIYQKMLDIWEYDSPGTVLYYPTVTYGIREGINWTPYRDHYLDFRANNLSFK